MCLLGMSQFYRHFVPNFAWKQGIEKPIACYSKYLNNHHQRYSTIKKAALALILAIQKLEFYVAGSQKELLVYTDPSLC